MIHDIPTGEYKIVKYEVNGKSAIMGVYENHTFWYHSYTCVETVFFIGGQHIKKCCGS